MQEILNHLEKKAREQSQSWEGYACFLRFLTKAQKRVPNLSDLMQYDKKAIDSLLENELIQIAELVTRIFPNGGIQELESYLPKDREL